MLTSWVYCVCVHVCVPQPLVCTSASVFVNFSRFPKPIRNNSRNLFRGLKAKGFLAHNLNSLTVFRT